MKRYILIFGLSLALNVYADEPTVVAETNPNDASTKCGGNCTWKLYSDGKLEISGTGDMYAWSLYNTHAPVRENSFNTYQTTAPWGNYSGQISTVKVNEGITSIGKSAFYNVAVTNADIAKSVATLESGAFQYSDLQNISLPSSLKSIGGATFYATSLQNLIVPEDVTSISQNALQSVQNLTLEGNTNLNKNVFWGDSDGTSITIPTNIYCLSSNASCNALKTDTDIGSKITSFTKEAGVYRLEDGTMFASPNNMMSGTNACVDLDTCKATVLQNKGYCTGDQACLAIVALENDNHPIEYNNKSYASIDDLLKGKYMPKRIYTIDEANRVAGTRNRISIKYR